LSPWLDATLSHPDVPEFDKIDPFLGVEGLRYGGRVYARDVDPKCYLVSPVYGSMKDLAPVSLFIGTRDILFPIAVSSETKLLPKTCVSITVNTKGGP